MAGNQVSRVFEQIRSRLEPVMQQLPTIVGNAAVNYSLDAFNKQSWDGKPWDKRKSKKDAGRSLLVKSGRGRRSIRIISTTANSVTIGSDVPYMAVHNNGGTINRAARQETFVRNRFKRGDNKGRFKRGTTSGEGFSFKAHSFNMPKRQFIGRSVPFANAMRDVIVNEYKKALK